MLQRIKNALSTRWNTLMVKAENVWHTNTVHELIILDDIFPYALSSFRIAEYSGYLQNIPTAVVYSSATAFGYVKETRPLTEVIAEYAVQHPLLARRVVPFHPLRKLRGRLGYVMFLHNAYGFLEVLEANKLPFVMQLFPGGNFRLNEAESDRQLARVCGSPCFRYIITTQNIIRDYLVAKGFCRPEQISCVYGLVQPLGLLLGSGVARPAYPAGKATLDVCFVAGKYMPEGRDKGYDLFVAAAKLLAPQFPALRFHVVGSFSETDIPVDELGERITFYGSRPTAWFVDFYARMDAIVSPNRSFVLAPGAFDGFPTGCCVEAGAAGVAVFCTDDLGQNGGFFTDGEDIVLLAAEAADVARKLAPYLAEPGRLRALGRATRGRMARLYDEQARLADRLAVINAQLNAPAPPEKRQPGSYHA